MMKKYFILKHRKIFKICNNYFKSKQLKFTSSGCKIGTNASLSLQATVKISKAVESLKNN